MNVSSWGWGAHLNSLWAQRKWTPEERGFSSNWKKWMAISRGLLAFQEQGHHLQARSDSTIAVAYINKQGGTKSPQIMLVAKIVFQWAENNIASISVVHLKGEQERYCRFFESTISIES